MMGNKILFNQKIPLKTIISESNNGVSLLFRSVDGETVLSNYGYIDGGEIIKQDEVFDIKLSDNFCILDGGFMYVSKINGILFNTVMSYTEISTIIDFSATECFQIGDFENDLENLFSITNFSSIKENINNGKEFIEKYVIDDQGNISEDKTINMQILKSGSCYSGYYNIPLEIKETYSGSTTPNIMGINRQSWDSQTHSWINDKNSINVLDKYFNKSLNIIHQ
jgi:hypothetical protein